MGVYIKGVELPKHDDEYVIFTVYGDGGVVYGPLNRPHVRYKNRAVPVPPHGRLIESVELYGKAEDIKTKAMSVCDKPQSWQFGVFWAIEQIEAALANAPTIIEVEGGET